MKDIFVHLPTETVFTSGGLLKNGEGALFPSKCVEKKDANTWEVELIAPLEYQTLLKHDYILYLESRYGYQPFRINNPEVGQSIRTTAKHVGYDLKNYYISNSTLVDATVEETMQGVVDNAYPACPFTVYSDITGIDTISVFEKSVYDGHVEIAEKSGGYLDFDHFQIRITETEGSDNDETIEYEKNLEGADVIENWDNVVTDLFPVGNNGLTLPEGWLHADIGYDRPYTKRMEFDTDTEENLRFVATMHLARFKYPNINYDVKSTAIQNVKLGDIIQVVSSKFTIQTNVIAYTYDVLKEVVTQVEFGNFRNTLRNYFGNLRAEIEKATLRKAQLKIDDANGKIDAFAETVTIEIREFSDELNSVNETVDNVKRNILFDENGVTVGAPGSGAKTNMDFDGFRVLEGDVETIKASGQQVEAPTFKAKYSVEVGANRIDDYNGAFLIRKVG